MISIVRGGHISASPDRVWSFVEDLDRLALWFSFGERFELLEGTGVGRRQRMHGKWGKKRSEIDQRVVALEPPRVLAWEHEAERLEGKPAPQFSRSTRFLIELTPEGEGTRVTLRSDQEPASALKGLVMKLFGTKEIARHLDRSVAQLREMAEARA